MKKAMPIAVLLAPMGRFPVAGIGWQVLSYLEGLRRLGYEAYLIEDTGDWPYDPDQNSLTGDPSYAVNHIGRVMAWAGFSSSWAYRSAAKGGQLYGLSERKLETVLASADVLINLTGATVLREEHLSIPVRIYLETDPVSPQVEIAQGRRFTIDFLGAHTHHFTYGENIGRPGCPVPTDLYSYQPTRQPVVLDWWPSQPLPKATRRRFTTVAQWKQTYRDIEWKGETYSWSKDVEFLKFLELPRMTSRDIELELALVADEDAVALLSDHGWAVIDGLSVSKDLFSYRNYIFDSSGEFSVAKDQNVRFNSGWFSDRSACYLACGKPVLMQDTGFGEVLPTGTGLFAFRTLDDILAALDSIESDSEKHSEAATEIANEYFRAEVVLQRLLEGSA